MSKWLTLVLLCVWLQNTIGQFSVEQELHHYVVQDLENYQESITVIGQNASSTEHPLGFLVNENAELLSYQLYERSLIARSFP